MREKSLNSISGEGPAWVPATLADIEDLHALAEQTHRELPERREVFADKIRHCPEGCRKLVYQDRLAGYGLSHPWRFKDIPALDTLLGPLPDNPDCLYLHDAVVHPSVRGLGASDVFIADSKALARRLGLPHLSLVSVYGTYVHWAKFGFTQVVDPALKTKLVGYGPTARYMVGKP